MKAVITRVTRNGFLFVVFKEQKNTGSSREKALWEISA